MFWSAANFFLVSMFVINIDCELNIVVPHNYLSFITYIWPLFDGQNFFCLSVSVRFVVIYSRVSSWSLWWHFNTQSILIWVSWGCTKMNMLYHWEGLLKQVCLPAWVKSKAPTGTRMRHVIFPLMLSYPYPPQSQRVDLTQMKYS